ncbi:MAG: hypothetical protein KatS3mg076_0899 [Candidatus Binatia bacterium]|nr:MAG: hypothetical protein KatS3mg076_0899 [Candidatus Binatia bacterium]
MERRAGNALVTGAALLCSVAVHVLALAAFTNVSLTRRESRVLVPLRLLQHGAPVPPGGDSTRRAEGDGREKARSPRKPESRIRQQRSDLPPKRVLEKKEEASRQEATFSKTARSRSRQSATRASSKEPDTAGTELPAKNSALPNAGPRVQGAASSDFPARGGDHRAGIFSVRELAFPPRLEVGTPPRYPAEAKLRGIEGRVVLEFVVDTKGSVEVDSIRVIESSPPFDRAAREAVRSWRFRPGRDAQGRAVRVLVQVPIRFRLR